jgi:hypothetical protein
VALTVICHVFNEDLLLPYWVRHHRELFDHGILIDYASTDRTVDVWRELAPASWQVVPSRNRDFAGRTIDDEVMDYERLRAPGWTVTLNVTEFLVHEDLRSYLADLHESMRPFTGCIALHSYVMVDALAREAAYDRPLDERPLWEQRWHGYRDPARVRGARFMHAQRDGAYGPGRHSTKHAWTPAPGDAPLILWWGWSPWPHVRARRLQIQTRIPQSDLKLGRGVQHVASPQVLDARFAFECSRAKNLLDDQALRACLGRLPGAVRWR